MSFCKCYSKELKDVTEREKERCYERTGRECIGCSELVTEEKTKAGINNETV